ncbi:MAG TPA: hypothetical protein VMR70_20110 [Flavisolibacter sp.]|nr:hypothetical protein [Flavisolibacter sp.]
MTKFSVLILSLVFLFASLGSVAQDYSTPGGYISHFNQTLQTMNQTYMNYISAVSHGKRAKKVEKLRLKTLDAILFAKGTVAGSPGFKNDKTFRDATTEYIKTVYIVFNEDYSKIVNMEEIAEQSYDMMEAYLLAQKKAGEKLKEASAKQNVALHEFAAKYNITLTDAKDELDLKLEKAAKVNDYYDKIYLIFFKSYKQDMYLTVAINKGDLNGVEQARNALETYATEGLAELQTIGSFQSDATVLAACKLALNFYKDLATQKMEPISGFLLTSDNFTKLKKNFEVMPAARRTQSDIDNYNKAVNDINKASNTYNKTNNDINKQRTDVLNKWNGAVKDFFDAQMPYAK